MHMADALLSPAVAGTMYLGSAAAAGPETLGYADVYELIERLGKVSGTVYHPIPENAERYRELYAQYRRLSELMAADGSVGRELLRLRRSAE